MHKVRINPLTDDWNYKGERRARSKDLNPPFFVVTGCSVTTRKAQKKRALWRLRKISKKI